MYKHCSFIYIIQPYAYHLCPIPCLIHKFSFDTIKRQKFIIYFLVGNKHAHTDGRSYIIIISLELLNMLILHLFLGVVTLFIRKPPHMLTDIHIFGLYLFIN